MFQKQIKLLSSRHIWRDACLSGHYLSIICLFFDDECSFFLKKQHRMADKVVQQWPKGKDSNTLKNSSHRRHSRWSLNLTALNSNIVLRQRSTTSVPDPAVSLSPARACTRACECYTKQGINSLSSSAAFDSSERPQTYTMSVWLRRVKSQTPQTRLVSKSEWHPRLDLFLLRCNNGRISLRV